jgi:hypothetical protein
MLLYMTGARFDVRKEEASSYCYMCPMCPHTAIYVSSDCYICVLMLLYMTGARFDVRKEEESKPGPGAYDVC